MIYRYVMNAFTQEIDSDQILLVPDEGNPIAIPRGHRIWADFEAWLASGNMPQPPL